MRLTGALTADATTLLPALAARNLKSDLRGTLIAGALIGLASNLAGFFLALALDLPVSPAVIITGAAAVFATGAATRAAGGIYTRHADRRRRTLP
jgi:zinc transport system permease protein